MTADGGTTVTGMMLIDRTDADHATVSTTLMGELERASASRRHDRDETLQVLLLAYEQLQETSTALRFRRAI